MVAMDEELDYEWFKNMMQSQWMRAEIFTDGADEDI